MPEESWKLLNLLDVFEETMSEEDFNFNFDGLIFNFILFFSEKINEFFL